MNFSLFYLKSHFLPRDKTSSQTSWSRFLSQSNHKNKPSHKRTPKRTPSVLQKPRGITNRRHKGRQAFYRQPRVVHQTASSFLEPRLANNAWGTKAPYARTKQTHFVHSSQALASSSFQSQLAQSSFQNQLLKSAVVTKNPSAVSLS